MASDIIGIDTLKPLFIAAGSEENKIDIFMRPDPNLDLVMDLIGAIKEKLVFAGLNAVKHTRSLAEYDYRIKGSKIIEVISIEVKPNGHPGELVGELVDNAVLELRRLFRPIFGCRGTLLITQVNGIDGHLRYFEAVLTIDPETFAAVQRALADVSNTFAWEGQTASTVCVRPPAIPHDHPASDPVTAVKNTIEFAQNHLGIFVANVEPPKQAKITHISVS